MKGNEFSLSAEMEKVFGKDMFEADPAPFCKGIEIALDESKNEVTIYLYSGLELKDSIETAWKKLRRVETRLRRIQSAFNPVYYPNYLEIPEDEEPLLNHGAIVDVKIESVEEARIFYDLLDSLREEKEINLPWQRMHEIAYLILKSEVRRRGVRYGDAIRSAGQVAKDTGIPKAEIVEFGRILNLELHEETFDI